MSEAYTIFFTNKCNLRCHYCYEKNCERNADISYSTLEAVLDFMQERNNSNEEPITVTIHGGEPLLEYKKIIWFIRQCRAKFQKPVIYSMTSNFTRVNDEIIQEIFPELFRIYVSVDGCAVAHDRNRVDSAGNGTYKMVKKNIQRVLTVRPDLTARMTIAKNTMGLLGESLDSMLNLGLKEISVELNINDSWNYEDLLEIQNKFRIINKKIKNSTGVCMPQLERKTHRVAKGCCTGGVHNFTINPNGDVFPCILAAGSNRYRIGNVYKGTSIRNLSTRYYVAGLDGCRGCSHEKICDAGRCKIINEIKTGATDTKWNYFCAKEHFESLISNCS